MLVKIKNYIRYKLYLFSNNGLNYFKIYRKSSYLISNLLIKFISKKKFFFIKLDESKIKLYNSKATNYKKYKNAQIRANIYKINSVWVKEMDIKIISQELNKEFKKQKIFGLCQGTRNGAEIKYFKSYLNNSKIIGTDISPTAIKFENTVQWDFNKFNNNFYKKFDFVYSNSHDHIHDLKKLC